MMFVGFIALEFLKSELLIVCCLWISVLMGESANIAKKGLKEKLE